LSKESRPCGFFNSPYVHFLRNALDYVPRKVDDDCLQELCWIYNRRNLAEARADLAAWIAKWQAKYPWPRIPLDVADTNARPCP
jgi:putative transposase